LTDSVNSPLGQFADLTLCVRSERRLAANSDAAVLAVIEALCDAVAYRTKRSAKAAADMTEFVLPWLTKTPSIESSPSTPSPSNRAASKRRTSATPATPRTNKKPKQ
jgi:hypothetical protein